MLIVGLTGGIATGKSTVSRELLAHSVPVIDADVVAHQVMEPGEVSYNLIVKHFGKEILQQDSPAIDRAKLGGIIFNDPEKRQLLNRCTHPYVRRRIIYMLLSYYVRGYPMCVLDVPLLYESGLDRICGRVAVVACSEERQISRLMDRNGFSKQEAEARISSQMPLKEKVRRATRVIDNNGSVEETHQQVSALIGEWSPSWIRTYGTLLAPVGILAGLPFARTTAGLATVCACAAWLVGSVLGF
ncbi:dephospho-CoA kinase [Martensiomyces pterosporus]|nr:dephospho-CoA kinase [Martensiomyces pterosporus]